MSFSSPASVLMDLSVLIDLSVLMDLSVLWGLAGPLVLAAAAGRAGGSGLTATGRSPR